MPPRSYFLLPFTSLCFPFFFNDPATTQIYTLSLHDALPISAAATFARNAATTNPIGTPPSSIGTDRKSTRLNSSHRCISYAVFCLKKKKDVVAPSLTYRQVENDAVTCQPHMASMAPLRHEHA